MHPIEACVRNPVKVWVGVILDHAVRRGGIAAACPCSSRRKCKRPRSRSPRVWPGASPQEVEQEIIQRAGGATQERREHARRCRRKRPTRMGTITLEFEVGIDLDVGGHQGEQAAGPGARLSRRRRQAGDRHQRLQRHADRLVHPQRQHASRWRTFWSTSRSIPRRRSCSSGSIVALKTNRDGLAELRLRRLVKRAWREASRRLQDLMPPDDRHRQAAASSPKTTSRPRFERVDGVSNANVFGGRDPELQIVVDPEKLAARQLTIQNVREVLRGAEQGHFGRRFVGGKAAVGRPHAGPVPLARASGGAAAGGPRRAAGVRARRGRGASHAQEARRLREAVRHRVHRGERSAARRRQCDRGDGRRERGTEGAERRHPGRCKA